MLFYLSAGLLGGVIVSLLTKPGEKEKLENFYALIRTPVQPGENRGIGFLGAVVAAKVIVEKFASHEVFSASDGCRRSAAMGMLPVSKPLRSQCSAWSWTRPRFESWKRC